MTTGAMAFGDRAVAMDSLERDDLAAVAARVAPPPPRRPLEWRQAWEALRALVADPERTDQVFILTTALSGMSGERLFQRFLAQTEGRALLARRHSLLDTLGDLDRLAAMPEGSFGRTYATFMRSENLDAAGLVEASMVSAHRNEELDPDRRWFYDRLRDMHDLWHVLTGYGRDEAGEAANLAFTQAQIRNPGVGLIVVAAALIGPKGEWLRWQRYLYGAWRRGRRAAFLPAVDYDALLPRPLADVRRSLGIEPPEQAHRGGVIVANRGEILGAAA